MSNNSEPSKLFDNVLSIASSVGAQGVFAKKKIAKGTIIQNDGFVWIVDDPDENESTQFKRNAYVKQWRAVCQKFSTDERKLENMILQLQPQRNTCSSMGAWLEAILQTNGWEYFYSTKYQKRAKYSMLLIYKGSKYNHSCKPSMCSTLANVRSQTQNTNQPSFAGVDKQFWVTALVDIKKGSEVSLSYLGAHDLDSSVEHRRELLKNTWDFDCECVKCRQDALSSVHMDVETPPRTALGTRKRRNEAVHAIRKAHMNIVDMNHVKVAKKSIIPQHVHAKSQRKRVESTYLTYPNEDQTSKASKNTTELPKYTSTFDDSQQVSKNEVLLVQGTDNESEAIENKEEAIENKEEAIENKEEAIENKETYSQHSVRHKVMTDQRLLELIRTNKIKHGGVDFKQLNIHGKLNWVERQSTPHGWIVMLSPTGLKNSRMHHASMTGTNNINDWDKTSDMQYWEEYQARCKKNLDNQKMTPRQKMICETEQNVYEAALTHMLIESMESKTQDAEELSNMTNTPSHSVETESHSVETPSHFVETPSHSVETPSHSVETPSHSVETPSHSVETVADETPTYETALTRMMIESETQTNIIFQHAILCMVSWLDEVVRQQIETNTAPLSTAGVICILCRLVLYANDLNKHPPWIESSAVMTRIQTYIRKFYAILCDIAKKSIPGTPTMFAITDEDPLMVVGNLMLMNGYTAAVLQDFSWFIFHDQTTLQQYNYLNYTPTNAISWWYKDLQKQMLKYSGMFKKFVTQDMIDNYCLFYLLCHSVRIDGTITLYTEV